MAYSFASASSQYLSTASAPASGAPMTLAAFGKIDTTTGTRTVIMVGVNAGTARNQVSFQPNTGGVIEAAAVGTTFENVYSTSTYSLNVFQHICGVFVDYASRYSFLNGGNKGTGSVNITSQTSATTIVIGARWNTTLGNYVNGQIAEAAVWSVALSDAEVASLGKGFKPYRIRPQSLVFYAPLIRDLQDTKGALAITNNNTATVAVHPRVY